MVEPQLGITEGACLPVSRGLWEWTECQVLVRWGRKQCTL